MTHNKNLTSEERAARKKRIYQMFFELLQVAIGTRSELYDVPSEKEWSALFLLSEKHAVTGIAFVGLRKLPDVQKPPHTLKKQWLAKVVHIQFANQEMNVKCREVCDTFEREGFGCCVLKGQGNLKYYGDIGLSRHSGDIDLWAWPLKKNGDDRKALVSFVLNKLDEVNKRKGIEIVYHHIDMPFREDVVVEAHFTPSWAYNPIHNHRMQKWFGQIKRDGKTIQKNPQGFYVPSVEFNIVYQLIHIYRHLFMEGIGLRQLLDYYMVLTYAHNHGVDLQEQKVLIDHFGMKKFLASVMYVIQEVFAMPDDYLLVNPNEKEGQHLLKEILIAGNFGQFDKRNKTSVKNSRFNRLIRRHRQTNRFFWSYPAESFFELPHRLWHYLWRKANGYL